MRLFRNHGITRDPKQFAPSDEVSAPSAPCSMLHAACSLPFYYEMVDLGYNYRITDFQCALGLSQLTKLPEFLQRRREIAALYDEALSAIPGIEPLGLRADVLTAAQSAKHETQSEERRERSASAIRSIPLCIRLRTPCSMLSAPCSMLSAQLPPLCGQG